MLSFAKKFDLRYYLTFLGLFSAVLVFHTGLSSAVAISGANSTMPDTSPFGQSPSYIMVQVTGSLVTNASTGQLNADKRDKARSTVANIYVPNSMAGQLINITVIGGCDFTTRDNDSGAGSTDFRILSPTNTTVSYVNSKIGTGCPGAQNIGLSFTAASAGTNCGVFCTYAAGQDWTIYHFVADGIAAEQGVATRYLNAFSLFAPQAGVQVGIADFAQPCGTQSGGVVIDYTISCPAPDPNRGQSVNYSNLYGPSGVSTFTAQIQIHSDCAQNAGDANITIYDLDTDDSGLNQNGMHMEMLQNGVAESNYNYQSGGYQNSLPFAAIQAWRDGIPGQLLPHNPRSTYNNGFMDLPGGDSSFVAAATFSAGVDYAFNIGGIDDNNSFQILPTFKHCQSAPPGTCTISAISHRPDGKTPIFTGDPVQFQVTTYNVPAGLQLGVNGPNYGPPGNFSNYLVSGSQYARASPVGVGAVFTSPANGQLPTSGTITIDDFTYNDNGGTAQITAPGSAGSYPFNWGLVNPGVAWSGIVCSGTLQVVAPQDIPTCTSATLTNVPGTTYPNSQFTMSITVRNDGNLTWVPGTWNLGSVQGLDNNYLTDGGGQIRAAWPDNNNVQPGGSVTFTYTTTLPAFGGIYPSNWKFVHELVAWENFSNGTQCGMNFVVEQGHFVDAFNAGINRPGSVDTCAEGTINADPATGYYTFGIPQGWGFCLRPSSSAAPNDLWIRPWNVGYQTGGTVCAPNTYCSAVGTYECQLAGVNGWPGCASGFEDRSQDWGYDFALAWRPTVSCTMGGGGTFEVGSYTPSVTVNSANTVGSGPQVSGAITYNVAAQNSVAGYGPVSTGGSASPAMPAVNIASAGNYTQTSSATWAGGPGVGAYAGTATCTGPPTATVVYKPYPKIYNGDVGAGGCFGSAACSPAGGGIYGFTRISGGYYGGASGELGVLALLSVNQFFSSGNRASVPPDNGPPRGSTFANIGGAGDATYGGALGGSGMRITDYFNDTRDTSLGSSTFVSGTFAAGLKQYVYPSGTLGAQTIPVGSQLAIYVDGNLYINGNITMASGTTLQNMPYFALIVRGNIYIAPGVSRLDGLYVAQPHSGSVATEGRIYTCASGLNTLYLSTQLLGSCATPLAINGAVVAQRIKFLRTINSVKDSTLNNAAPSGEIPNFADGSASGNGANTKASEVINFSPELFIAPSPLKDPNAVSASTTNKYDAYYSLPPLN